jgi:hypothetical protein
MRTYVRTRTRRRSPLARYTMLEMDDTYGDQGGMSRERGHET